MKGGNFVCKVFDSVTLFTMGVLHLLWRCFERVSLYKPESSRPGSSERYFVCESLISEEVSRAISMYLMAINLRYDFELLHSVVTPDVLNDGFVEYVTERNNADMRLQLHHLLDVRDYMDGKRCITLVDRSNIRAKKFDQWKLPRANRGGYGERYRTRSEVLSVCGWKDEWTAVPRVGREFLSSVVCEDWMYVVVRARTTGMLVCAKDGFCTILLGWDTCVDIFLPGVPIGTVCCVLIDWDKRDVAVFDTLSVFFTGYGHLPFECRSHVGLDFVYRSTRASLVYNCAWTISNCFPRALCPGDGSVDVLMIRVRRRGRDDVCFGESCKRLCFV